MKNINAEESDGFAAILCDSVYTKPYELSAPEVNELLLACALENQDAQADECESPDWACFLITDAGVDMSSSHNG